MGRMETTNGAGEPAGRPARDVGAIHRHVAALLNVADGHASVHGGRLEAKAAPDQEGDQVVAPYVGDGGGLVDQLAVLPHPVAA